MYIIIILCMAFPQPLSAHTLTALYWMYRYPTHCTTKKGSPQQVPLLCCPSRQTDWSLPHMDSSQRSNLTLPQRALP